MCGAPGVGAQLVYSGQKEAKIYDLAQLAYPRNDNRQTIHRVAFCVSFCFTEQEKPLTALD